MFLSPFSYIVVMWGNIPFFLEYLLKIFNNTSKRVSGLCCTNSVGMFPCPEVQTWFFLLWALFLVLIIFYVPLNPFLMSYHSALYWIDFYFSSAGIYSLFPIFWDEVYIACTFLLFPKVCHKFPSFYYFSYS